MVEFLLTHVLELSVTKERIRILVSTRTEVTVSALVGVRGCLPDHSDNGSWQFDLVMTVVMTSAMTIVLNSHDSTKYPADDLL